MEKQPSEDIIRTLSSREAVRLKPTFYLDKLFREGNLDALPLEVACHAIDEFHDNNCSFIEITVYSDRFSLKYDAGMSLNDEHGQFKAVTVMTSLFACRNEKKHLSVGEEFCELGIATVNFCSEHCTVITTWKGKTGTFIFEKGLLIDHSIEHDSEREETTEITIVPDKSIFDDLTFSFSGIEKKVQILREKLNGLTLTIVKA